MTVLPDFPQSLGINIAIFIIGALVVAVAGSKMALLANLLADRTGLGEAVTGTLFLGLVTALPGLTATVTTAMDELPVLTASNALGGIAIQTAFLSLADFAYRKANLEHAAASLSNMIQTGILIFLLSLILLGFSSPNISLWHIHPMSFLLVACTVGAVNIIYHQHKNPMWHPHRTAQTVYDIPEKNIMQVSLAKLLFQFVPIAIAVLIGGYLVGKSAGVIALETGLGQSFVGAAFLAFATSLPELVTTISAVRVGALTLAVGDIVGGNVFDALFMAVGDIFYTPGSIYHALEVGPSEIFLVGLCILLNVTLLLGLLLRQEKGPGNIGVESSLMLIVYLASLVVLYFS